MSELTYPYRYCIKHERIVSVVNGWDETVYPLGDYCVHFGADVEFPDWPCHGPFTTSFPPEDHRLNWDRMDEPSVEELEQMNENALSLRADFELLES